jgi:hypothetical protein
MTDDDDVLQPGTLDVADERVDEVGDGDLSEVSGLVTPAGQIDREHGQLRCQPLNLGDGEIPGICGEAAAMHEDQSRQCH